MNLVYFILFTYFFGVVINSFIVLFLVDSHRKHRAVTSFAENFDYKKTFKFIFLSWYSFNKALTKLLE